MNHSSKTRVGILILLALIGTVLCALQFLPWYAEHGVNMHAFFREAFASGIPAGLTWDLIVSAVIMSAVAFWDRKTIGLAWVGLIIASMIFIGIYLGLCLYFIRRELAQAAR